MPYAVEICFGVGPLAASIDRVSGTVLSSGRHARLEIKRDGRAAIPSNSFLDNRFSGVSALMGINLDMNFMGGIDPQSVAVHNPMALNPVAPALVPAQQTWGCHLDTDKYIVERLN